MLPPPNLRCFYRWEVNPLPQLGSQLAYNQEAQAFVPVDVQWSGDLSGSAANTGVHLEHLSSSMVMSWDIQWPVQHWLILLLFGAALLTPLYRLHVQVGTKCPFRPMKKAQPGLEMQLEAGEGGFEILQPLESPQKSHYWVENRAQEGWYLLRPSSTLPHTPGSPSRIGWWSLSHIGLNNSLNIEE